MFGFAVFLFSLFKQTSYSVFNLSILVDSSILNDHIAFSFYEFDFSGAIRNTGISCFNNNTGFRGFAGANFMA